VLEGVAQAFPELGEIIYMNTASVGAGCAPAVEAFVQAIDDWRRGRFDWTAGELAAEEARRRYAELINAPAETVAMIPAASAVAGLVANHLALERMGGNVVIGGGEFNSNHFAWRLLADHGYDVRLVPFVEGGASAEAFAGSADDDTRLIAVSMVQSASGYRVDLAALSAVAQSCGAILFVDASQGVGALPLDVGEVTVDAVAACAHKFLLGTRGMGYGYFRPELRDAMRPITAGWAAAEDPLTSFYGPDMTLSATASRFDMSTAWFNALADRRALEVMRDIGFDRIHDHNRTLSDHMRAALADAGIPFLDHGPDNSSTIFSLEPTVGDIPGRLAAIDAVTSERAGRIRISLHLYNSTEQIDAVIGALAE
jgi:cysteine desulfurase/selenocysteine lyase